jgi:hypothetical protein
MSGDEATLREQLSQALETYRVQQNLLVQVASALIAADIIVLGYGFSQRSPVVIWLAALLPLVGMVAGQRVYRSSLSLAYFGYVTESQLLNGSRGLITTFLEINSPKTIEQIRKIVDQSHGSTDEQIKAARLYAGQRETLKRNPPTVGAAAFAVQIVLAIVATFAFR